MYKIGDEKEIALHRTKRGLPALWEGGGGLSNTGHCQIVAGPEGQKKKALYIARKGSLACADHALFVVEPGDLFITANHHRRDFTIRVWQITGFETQGERDVAKARLIYVFDEGEWDPQEPSGTLAAAVQAAKEKAVCYHCRSPHWIANEE